jgi:hypothetical protein
MTTRSSRRDESFRVRNEALTTTPTKMATTGMQGMQGMQWASGRLTALAALLAWW